MNCSSLLPTQIFLSCILKGLHPKYSISQAYGYSQGLLFLWLLHGSHTTQELPSLPVVLITGKTYRGPIAFPTPNCVWGGGAGRALRRQARSSSPDTLSQVSPALPRCRPIQGGHNDLCASTHFVFLLHRRGLSSQSCSETKRGSKRYG